MNTQHADVSAQLAQILQQQQPKSYDFNAGATSKPEIAPPGPPPESEQRSEEAFVPQEAEQAEFGKQEEKPRLDFEERMQRLAEGQRRWRAEQEAAKAERAKFEADMAELQQLRELKARAKDDPVALAEWAGFKPDEYATTLMEKGSMSPERRRLLEQQKEIQELKSWKQQQEEQRKQAEFQSVQSTVMQEMQRVAQEGGERFELVSKTGAYQQVIKEIEAHYQATMDPELGQGEILSYEEALERVESKLLDYYSPLLQSNKLRSKLGHQTSAPTSSAPALRKPSATITSKMQGGRQLPPREMTESERMQAVGDMFLKSLRGGR